MSEMKKRVTGDISKLNQRLLRVSRGLEREARSHPAIREVPGRILISLFRKAVNTFDGIEALKRRKLIEEAWVLLRVLLEAHVNLVYFMTHDPKDMSLRYLDASLLEKLKHLREVKFYEGTPLAAAVSRDDWETQEAAIKARYSAEDFAALKRHGFTGLSFEQRAKAVGLERMYWYCYRIASRSVHMLDPAETALVSATLRGRRKEKYDLLRARREQLEGNQNMLLGRLAYVVSEFTRSSKSLELIMIGVGYEKFLDSAKTLERGSRGQRGDEDELRIWTA